MKNIEKYLRENGYADRGLNEKFEFRDIHKDEANQAVEIEQICFPPHEACSKAHMKDRIEKVPELFLVAIDKETGKIAGFLNGIATNEKKFRDEFFTEADLNESDGDNVMLLGLDVLPQYRGQGLATEIVFKYLCREEEKGRKRLILTCLDGKIKMYEKMRFVDLGISDSVWGDEEWHDMCYTINVEEK